MRVDFYSFSKKNNSTKIPTGSALASYDCVLKDGCTVLSPVIILEVGLTNRPAFNYAYIPDFERYYFIDEWTFNRRMWTASMSVDVLGTYKSSIGSKNLYILRSSAAYNGRIIDGKYPTISQPSTYIDSLGTVYETDNGTDYAVPNFFNTLLGNGYYYIGIVGSNGTGVKWYVFNATGFNELTNSLMNYVPTDVDDFSSGVAKQLANPIQYIVTAYWLPYLIHGVPIDQAGMTINFGSYSIRAHYCNTFDPIANMHKFHADFNIRKHPQAASRGAFLNQQPYTRYTVDFLPFGVFELDGTLMIDDSSVTCEWYTDYSTGMSELLIKASNSLIAHSSAMLGVPVRLAQATLDLAGMGSDTMLGMLNVSANKDFWKPILSGVVGEISSVGLQPKIAKTGSSGSFIPFKILSPKLYTDFYLVADEDNADNGRPLLEIRTPSSLGGYMIADHGNMEHPKALAEEIVSLNSYITGGFFYE